MKSTSFIYFDLGGVVFDYEKGLIKLAERNGHTINELNQIFEPYAMPLAKGEMELDELWKIYKKALQMKEPETFNFTAFWIENFIPILPTHELIQKLSVDYELGLITNIYHHMFDKVYAKGYVPPTTYKAVVKSCDIHYAKPEEHMYHIAQAVAGVTAKEILYIDDKPEFIEVAKRFGWNGIHFRTHEPENSIQEIITYLEEEK